MIRTVQSNTFVTLYYAVCSFCKEESAALQSGIQSDSAINVATPSGWTQACSGPIGRKTARYYCPNCQHHINYNDCHLMSAA